MELRPKALAVYEAVLDLLDGGADLNSITVSEIAERAGIGKGTAYEYFSSKEDMVGFLAGWPYILRSIKAFPD